MNVIFPIRKKYSDFIFSGRKPMEFRNRLPKLKNGDKCYIYECKNGGCGMVVGYFTVKSTETVKHSSLGCYPYLQTYASLYANEEDKKLIDKAMSIDLIDCKNDLVCYYLFMEDCLNEMLETKRPPKSVDNLIRFHIYKYEKLRNKSQTFCENCDKWLKDCGFYDDNYDSMYWKYQINIDKVVKFENPKPISEFYNKNGDFIEKAPQSFCYTIS